MFRLRFDCPFGGHGHNVFWIGILLVLLSVLMTVINDGNIIAAVVIPAVTVLIGGYIWANRITELDRKNMNKAELPLWRPLTDDERKKVLKRKKFSLVSYIIMFATVALFLIMPPKNSSARTGFEDKYTRMIGFTALEVMAAVMVLDYINCLRWKSIDDTAVCTEVPVHLHFSIEHYNRGSSYTTDYIVIYLPDGKYVLRSNLAGSQTVKLVRYNGMLMYFEDDVDEDVVAWKN